MEESSDTVYSVRQVKSQTAEQPCIPGPDIDIEPGSLGVSEGVCEECGGPTFKTKVKNKVQRRPKDGGTPGSILIV